MHTDKICSNTQKAGGGRDTLGCTFCAQFAGFSQRASGRDARNVSGLRDCQARHATEFG